MALQELAKLDEYGKQLEKAVQQQSEYIKELEKIIDRHASPQIHSTTIVAEDEVMLADVDAEMTE
jgi:hypothetical protein